jgi:hypothetical protein
VTTNAKTQEITADAVLAMTADELAGICSTVEVPEFTEKFIREQNAGPREFNVRGPKADAIRALIFLDAQLTRKEISNLTNASVSRVGEVVWGLEHDGTEFPELPKRRQAVAVEDVAETA